MSLTNPFVGPRPLRGNDGIYGRDREIERLLNTLLAERIVLLHAPSGAGKSSLVAAGLLPAVAAEGLEQLPIMRVNQLPVFPSETTPPAFNRYLQSLFLSLEQAYGEETESEPAPPRFDQALPAGELLEFDTLDSYLQRRWAPREDTGRQLLIFDQFEEILTIDDFDREGKQQFFQTVGRALRDQDRYALFIMRDDYVAAVEQYVRYIPSRLRVHFPLDLLTENGAIQAVQGIANTQKVKFETEAARKLVNDLRRIHRQRPDGEMEALLGPFVEPVLLQVACLNLWDDLDKNGKLADKLIDADDVAGMIDMTKALGQFYARSIQDVAAASKVSERWLRQWVQDNLISEQGIRKQVLREKIQTNGIPTRALLALRDKYVLRIEQRHNAGWFELAHDRLVGPIQANNQEWFTEQLGPLPSRALLWRKQNRPDDLLLRGDVLTKATADHQQATAATSEYKESEEFTALVQEFLTRSQEQEEKRTRQERARLRQRNWVMAFSALLLVAVVIVSILALDATASRNESVAAGQIAATAAAEAEASALVAEQRRLEADAQRAAAQAAESTAVAAQATAEAGQSAALAAEADAEEARQDAEQAQLDAEQARDEAVQSAALAEANRLLLYSQLARDNNPARSILLALQAWRTAPNADTQAAVAQFITAPVVTDLLSTASQFRYDASGELLLLVNNIEGSSRLEIWEGGLKESNSLLWCTPTFRAINQFALNETGEFLAITTPEGVQIYYLGGALTAASDAEECANKAVTASLDSPPLASSAIITLDWLNGLQLVLGSNKGELLLWQLRDSQAVAPANDIVDSALSQQFAVEELLARPPEMIQSRLSLTETLTLTVADQGFTASRLSPDSQTLVLLDEGGNLTTIILEDTEEGAATLRAYPAPAIAAAIPDAGTVTDFRFVGIDILLAATSTGGLFFIPYPELLERNSEWIFMGSDTAPIHLLATSPSSSIWASANSAGSVLVWDLFEPLAQLTAVDLTTLALTADGRQLVTGSDGGQILLWDTLTGLISSRLPQQSGPIQAAHFNPGNPAVLTVLETSGELSLWRFPSDRDSGLSGLSTAELQEVCRLAGRNLTYEEWGSYVDREMEHPYEIICSEMPLPEGVVPGLVQDGINLAFAEETALAEAFLRQAAQLDEPGMQAITLEELDLQTVTPYVDSSFSGAVLAEDPAGIATLLPLLQEAIQYSAAGDAQMANNIFLTALASQPALLVELIPYLAIDLEDFSAQLQLQANLDAGAELAALAQPLAVGDTVTGWVVPEGGQIWQLTVDAAQFVVIDMQAVAGESSLDTYLYVQDGDGFPLAENDDIEPPIRDSQVSLLLPASGDYFILARGFGSSSGSYQLTVSSDTANLSADQLFTALQQYAQSGEQAIAAQLFAQLQQRTDVAGEQMLTYGLRLTDLVLYTEAAWFFEVALATLPPAELDTYALLTIGRTMAIIGDTSTATSLLANASTRADLLVGDLVFNGILLSQAGAAEMADGYFDLALITPVDSWQDWVSAALQLFANEQPAQANLFLDRLLAEPGLSVANYLDAGQWLAESGQPAAAAQAFAAAISLDAAAVPAIIRADPESYALEISLSNRVDEVLFSELPISDRYAEATFFALQSSQPLLAYQICLNGQSEGYPELVIEACEYAASLNQPLTPGQRVTGRVLPGGGQAWLVTVPAGATVTISMRSTDMDTYLELYDAALNLITLNDDFSQGESIDTNSFISIALSEAGEYLILASGFGDSAGSYELIVTVQ